MDNSKIEEMFAQRPSEELSASPHAPLPKSLIENMQKFQSAQSANKTDQSLIDALKGATQFENEFSLEFQSIDLNLEDD